MSVQALESVAQTCLHKHINSSDDSIVDKVEQEHVDSDDDGDRLHIDDDETVDVPAGVDFDGDFMACPDGTAYIIRDTKDSTHKLQHTSSVQKFQICDSFSAVSYKFSHPTEARHRLLVCLLCKVTFPTYTPFTVHLSTKHNVCLGHQEKLALGNPAVSVVFQHNESLPADKADSQLTFMQPVEEEESEPKPSGSFNDDMARNLQLASQLSASRILQQVSQNALVMAVSPVNPFSQAAACALSSPSTSSSLLCPPLVSTPPTAARNSCKTLKCPQCNWHYKYQETLEIHMKEKHTDMNLSPDCSYCRTNSAHPKLARGETYSCGYKPYRCDVCKYSTTTKGNLSIHMQSDKHLNNVQELQQQQAASGNGPVDLGAYIHAPPTVQVMTTAPVSTTPSHTPKMAESKPEVSKSVTGANVINPDVVLNQYLDMNPTLLQQQGSMLYGHGGGMYHCCVCATYNTDDLDALLSHVNEDRTISLPSDVSQIQGIFHCNLCNYGSKLKANFQLHTKTDKHMQRLQLVNHVREGGVQNEWRLRYASVNNPVHLRCSPCAEFFTSWHKLQSHVTTVKHKCMQNHFLSVRSIPAGAQAICKLCSTVLSKPADMYAHLQSQIHLNAVMPHLDAADADVPADVTNALQLVQNNTEEEEEDWKNLCPDDVDMTDAVLCCACCSYTCSNPSALKQHVHTQHGHVSNVKLLAGAGTELTNKQIHCPLCSADCGALIDALKMHLSQVHNVSEKSMHRLLSMPSPASPPASVPADSTTSGHNDDEDNSCEECYSCPMCLVPFKTCDELYMHQADTGHILQQTNEHGQPTYACWFQACNKVFSSLPTVQMHFRENHAKIGNGSSDYISDKHTYKFRCGQCSLAFRTEEKLQAHSVYHVMRASTRCAACGRNFRSISSLRRHVEQEHVSTTSNGHQATATDTQQQHTHSHLQNGDNENDNGLGDNNEVTIDTSDPDYPLNTNSAAEAAYQDHSRKYRCHKCKMAFTSQAFHLAHTKSALHRRSDRPTYSIEKYKDPNRPFKCDMCMESFTQRNILSVHYNSVSHLHKVKKLLEQKAPNTVITPEMVAAINKQQQAHKNIPTAPFQNESADAPKCCTPKPYRCNLCQHSSSQGTTFDIHLRSVGHQSRVGKLQELVAKGEVDANVALIEQPDMMSSSTASLPPGITAKQILQQMHKHTDNETKNAQLQAQQTALVNMMSLAQFAPFLTHAFQPLASKSDMPGFSGPHNCPKCSAAFSTDVGLQVHMMQCFGTQQATPNSASSANKNDVEEDETEGNVNKAILTKQLSKNGTAFRRLLENFGFEEVMEFNENLQQRKRKADKETEPEKEGEESISKKVKVDSGGVGHVECSHCQRHFSSIWVLKAHIERMHGETVPTEMVEEMSEHVKQAIESSAHTADVKSVDTSMVDLKPTTQLFNSPTDGQLTNANPVISTTPQTTTVTTITPSTPAKSARSSSTNRTTVPQPNFSQANALQTALANMAMAGMGAQTPFNFMPPFGGFGMSPFLPFMMPSMVPTSSSGEPLEMLKAAASNANSGASGGMNDGSMMAAVAQQQAALAQQQAAGNRRARTRITDDQLKVLREYFDINNSPTEEMIEAMSRKSGLPQKVIKHWFRNTLFKERQRNKDSPYNFSIPPSLGIDLEEYEKTGNAKIFNISNPAEVSEVVQPKVDKPETDSDEKSSDEQMMQDETDNETYKVTPQPDPIDDYKYGDDAAVDIKMEPDNVATEAAMIDQSAMLSAQETLMRMQQLPPQLAALGSLDIVNNPFTMLAAAQAAAAAAGFQQQQNSSVSPAMSSSSAVSGMQGSYANSDSMSNLLAMNSNQTGYTPGRRANRTRFTDQQLKTLQDFFDKQAYPKDDDLEFLSKKMQLSPRVIVVWFQNARQKARKVYENQPPDSATSVETFAKAPTMSFQGKSNNSRYYELMQPQQKDESKRSSSRASPRSTGSSMSPGAGHYACHQCNVSFSSPDALNEHLTVHAKNPLLFMEEQSRKMDLKELLAEQTRQQNVKTEPAMPSTPQGRVRSRGGSVSSQPSQSFNKRCPFCGILFHSKLALVAHIPERHAEQFRKTRIDIDLLPQAEEVPTITTANVASTSMNGVQGTMAGGTRSPMDVLKRLSERAGITSSGGSPLDLSRPMKVQTENEDVSASNSASPNASALSMSDFEDEMSNSFGPNTPSPCPSTSLNNGGGNVIVTTQSFARPHNKRFRTHLSPMQVQAFQVMKHTFVNYKTPSMSECEQLGSIIGLHKRVVQVWFQNARAKERKVKTSPASQSEVQNDVTRPVPSRCDICEVTYSSKISIQDHLFNPNHVKKLKELLRAKGTDETYNCYEPPQPPSKKAKENGNGAAKMPNVNTTTQSCGLNAMMLAAASAANPAAYMSMMGAAGLPLYDPVLFGTPVQMLQIPPSVQQNIVQSMQKATKLSTRFTQDGKIMADLKGTVSDRDFKLCNEKDLEVGWACRKCGTVFQSEPQFESHRGQVCQCQETVFKLIQTHYNCIACDAPFGTQKEYAEHCSKHH